MGNISFSKQELERYSRHLIIPEFNIEGQQKLKAARVLVVGTGGLGAPLLQYLAAAGVGHIGLVDFDVVDASNLQRQVLFGVQDVGKPKVEVAASRLRQLNPYIEVATYNVRFTSENALDIMRGYDVVADGTDNFPTRYLVNDASVILGIPNVYASIYRFEGQASVFNYTLKDGTKGPQYRDLFPSPPPPELVPSCAEGGVLGVLPGILGSIQALEVIKVITGLGDTLVGRLFLLDAATFETRILKIKARKDTAPITELIDYEAFCAYDPGEKSTPEEVQELTVKELQKWTIQGKDYQLIDVREPYEFDIANMGAELIPKDEVTRHLDQIRRDIPVVVHCRSGKRSADVIRLLRDQHGYDNLLNLKGGILAYAEQIDQSIAKY
jgi:sulfur-carrier protein adenylyltransferase/sulfurtransferase